MNANRNLAAAGMVTLIALTVSASATAAAECLPLSDFNRAIQAKDIDAAKSIEKQILSDATCGAAIGTRAMLQRSSLEVVIAQEALNQPGGAAARERLLLDAASADVFWYAADLMGELRFSQRRFADAAGYFEQAIEIIKNASKTPTDPGTPVKKQILNRATQARLLAANEEDGSGAQYVNPTRDFRDGTLGGLFSETVRGFKVESTALPINFETGTDKPTALGLKAEADMLKAIQEQGPSQITIVGHTDERGADAYNMRLSDARARAVAKFLGSNGVTAKITTLGRGWHEPFAVDAASGLAKSDIWALNRRVEWRRQ